MKRKIIISLILICVAAACVAVAGCMTDLERLIDEGYVVLVTYDANGGNYGDVGQTIRIDAFNPSDFTADENGDVHIKLQDFEDRNSFTGVADVRSPIRESYGFWGWYQTRELYLVDGNPVDIDGNVLVEDEDDGIYRIKGTDTESQPLYTYSGRWDFDEDEIIYRGEELLEVTLYAAWVPYFEFDFYYVDESGAEVQYGTSSFNYANYVKNQDESNLLVVPSYPDGGGAMSYTYRFDSGVSFAFPSLSGYTFSAAYYYPDDVETEITEKLPHWGYVDDEVLTHDYKMKILVEFVDGERYLIKTAQQFRENSTASTSFYYIIAADIDFGGESGTLWPANVARSTFSGTIVSDGQQRTLSNIYVRYAEDTTYGGLFGCIGSDAVISGITFENVTFDLYSMSRNVSYGFYGLFAGYIEDGVTLTDVALSGKLEFTIGAVSCDSTGKSINLLSSSDLSAFGVNLDGVEEYVLSCYSNNKSVNVTADGGAMYNYTVVAQGTEGAISMNENFEITYSIYSSRRDTYTENGESKYYEENYYIIYSSLSEE